MANIALKDTGFVKVNKTGSVSTKANSGSEFELKGVSVTYQLGSNFAVNPIPGQVSAITEVNTGSTDNAAITIEGIFNQRTSSDMDKVRILREMVQTEGVKLFYYTDTTDGYRDLTDALGTTNQTDVHVGAEISPSPFPHLHVRVTGFQITHEATSGFIRYRISMTETG